MSWRYRVALHGFSEHERATLTLCLRQAALRVPGYVQVDRIADCDFVIADASLPPSESSRTRGDRLRDTLFVGERPPPGATMHVERPLDPGRVLRALDAMVAVHEARHQDALPAPLVFDHEPSTVSGFDSVWPLESTNSESAQALASPPRQAGRDQAERAAAKAAARRASRLARLAHSGGLKADAPSDLLLFDAAPDALVLRMLLERFGFRVHRVVSGAQATALLERIEFAAAFLDFEACDGNEIDGPTLCRLIKQRRLNLPGKAPAIVLVSGDDSALARIYAQLAGCDAFLARPVTRGEAARALEACGVALPADARKP